jgi:hypothetical protein
MEEYIQQYGCEVSYDTKQYDYYKSDMFNLL